MSEFVFVAQREDLRSETGLTVEVKGRLIALFLQEETICAIDDCCPHMGASLGSGSVTDGVVMCPWHAWRFRVCDGAWVDAPDSGTRVNSYNAKFDGDRVLLEITW